MIHSCPLVHFLEHRFRSFLSSFPSLLSHFQPSHLPSYLLPLTSFLHHLPKCLDCTIVIAFLDPSAVRPSASRSASLLPFLSTAVFGLLDFGPFDFSASISPHLRPVFPRACPSSAVCRLHQSPFTSPYPPPPHRLKSVTLLYYLRSLSRAPAFYHHQHPTIPRPPLETGTDKKHHLWHNDTATRGLPSVFASQRGRC